MKNEKNYTSSHVEIPKAQMKDSGKYTCFVTNTHGNNNSNSVDIIVQGIENHDIRLLESPN